MFRIIISIAALACGTACAAPPADDAQAATSQSDASKPFAIKPTTATAAPNQVFPPIPSFASLPPPAGDSDEDAPAAAPAENRHSKKGRRAPVKKAPEMQVRMVVSDESHAYLANVETQLDALLQSPSRDRHVAAGAVSVAMWH
ncbi:hypothetical protein FAZ95_20325 [Trinickia violacea]|uniref:Uncharacterized protein n=1 Tax=Trinickia violacea TaxID=2571746 RepID=A0A4P8IQD3_9BURK|nr:hypothetical protein [Trinickia violacea]QCP51288.1 hypothetical protein FAZ95_20325 [Trinickia violacea]